MFDLDKWQEIISTLTRNPLRLALTALGVFWGIFMLVILIGAGNGLENGVKSKMFGFATNAVYMWSGRTTMSYGGMKPGRPISFDNDDVRAIREQVEGIEFFAPRNQLGGWQGGNNVVRGVKTGNFSVMGDYPDFEKIQPVNFIAGRFINPLDIDERRKVCVIGDRVRELLYEEGEEVIGSYIRIQGVYFRVVGHFTSFQGGEGRRSQTSTIYIPFTTFQQAFNYGNRVGWFALTADPGYSTLPLEDDVRALLSGRKKFDPKDREAVGSWNAQKRFERMDNLFGGIKFIVFFVGLGTLLAGVIGVSNIMLITVRERTKEIGIRKAIGARPWSIVSQILQESMLLTFTAGYFGLVLGVILLELLNFALSQAGTEDALFKEPGIDIGVALVSMGILVVAGLVAGIAPALNAARVNPIEALRAE